MNRSWLLILSSIFFIFFSCRKEQAIEKEPLYESQLRSITEVKGNVSTVTTFMYDENKRLSAVKKGNDITLYTYSGNKIINIEVNEGSKTTSTSINYRDSIPYTGISKIYEVGVLQKTLDVNFSSSLSGTGQVNFYDNGATFRKVYYVYENGNITESQVLQNRTLTSYDYTYGERKNILFNANTRWALGLDNIDRVSTNEVIRVITEIGYKRYIKKYTYTYNEEGLPISALITETDPPLNIERKTSATYTYEKL